MDRMICEALNMYARLMRNGEQVGRHAKSDILSALFVNEFINNNSVVDEDMSLGLSMSGLLGCAMRNRCLFDSECRTANDIVFSKKTYMNNDGLHFHVDFNNDFNNDFK